MGTQPSLLLRARRVRTIISLDRTLSAKKWYVTGVVCVFDAGNTAVNSRWISSCAVTYRQYHYTHMHAHTDTDTDTHIHIFRHQLANITLTHTHAHNLIKRTPPPPRGGFLFTMFPDPEPCVRDFTTRRDRV